VLKYLSYAPVIFLSALEGTGPGSEKTAAGVERGSGRGCRTAQARIDGADEPLPGQDRFPARAPVPMAKRLRIFYMTQAAVAPPTFVLFTDRDIKLHFSFERFLENQNSRGLRVQGNAIWFKVKARNAEKKDG